MPQSRAAAAYCAAFALPSARWTTPAAGISRERGVQTCSAATTLPICLLESSGKKLVFTRCKSRSRYDSSGMQASGMHSTTHQNDMHNPYVISANLGQVVYWLVNRFSCIHTADKLMLGSRLPVCRDIREMMAHVPRRDGTHDGGQCVAISGRALACEHTAAPPVLGLNSASSNTTPHRLPSLNRTPSQACLRHDSAMRSQREITKQNLDRY